jgi:hypothetical protein
LETNYFDQPGNGAMTAQKGSRDDCPMDVIDFSPRDIPLKSLSHITSEAGLIRETFLAGWRGWRPILVRRPKFMHKTGSETTIGLSPDLTIPIVQPCLHRLVMLSSIWNLFKQ